jgi:tetratricopeptide (TPR) repeat protein
MPVSTSVHISHCTQIILQLNPASVLDVGCGFGLWGFLCREYLDVFCERVQPEQWKVRIDAVEVFEPYIQAHQRALYDSIIVADIRDAAPRLDSYDLIIVGDMIEHLDKAEGMEVLECLYEKAHKALLVNVPIGSGWDHPEKHGNPAELHRSEWAVEDFAQFPNHYDAFTLPCGDYGVFYCPKDAATQEGRVSALLAAAEHCDAQGNTTDALRHLEKAQRMDPANQDAASFLADVLLRAGQAQQAVAAIDEAVQADPAFHRGYFFAARILAAKDNAHEAGIRLETLLNRDDVPPELRAEAEQLQGELGL